MCTKENISTLQPFILPKDKFVLQKFEILQHSLSSLEISFLQNQISFSPSSFFSLESESHLSQIFNLISNLFYFLGLFAAHAIFVCNIRYITKTSPSLTHNSIPNIRYITKTSPNFNQLETSVVPALVILRKGNLFVVLILNFKTCTKEM